MTVQVVPLGPVPAQTLSIILGGQNCAIAVNTLATGLFFSLTADGVTVCVNTICHNLARLVLNRGYTGFVGDLVFIDTQGDADPEYSGLGERWQLLYNDGPPPVPVFL